MNPEIKDRWVAALRSGNYKQTKKRLRSDAGYCCWGVLCDLLKEDVEAEWMPTGDGELFYFVTTPAPNVPSFSVAFPPVEVTNAAGIPQSSVIDDETQRVDLYFTCLNDGGTSFDEIADRIEELL